MCFFFFFKQKTAYEMRISDWSSDVCSSDLIELEVEDDRMVLRTERFREMGRDSAGNPEVGVCLPDTFDVRHFAVRSFPERWAPWECARLIGDMFADKLRFPCPKIGRDTSELQSLMRISYAVFCLTKKI